MEHNPNLTPTYLAGKVDQYVKFQARDTISRNAKRDKNARYARIPDGGACDFCRMLGSRGFVYHSEELAGGVAHGSKYDTYHPYCNCQIAVCFDPFIEEYYVGLTKVTRGYGGDEGILAVPGRDGSYELREADIDALYDEYKAMGKSFTSKSKYKDYTRGAKLSDEAFDDAMRRLSEAETLDELHAIGKEIVDAWPENANGRDAAQWDEMSRHAQELEKQFKASNSSSFNGDLRGPNIPGYKYDAERSFKIQEYLSTKYGVPEPLSFDEANHGRCNPLFGERGYSSNCQTTSVVYELRRRGFNVEALPRSEGNSVMDTLADDPLSIYRTREGKPVAGKELMGYSGSQAVSFLEGTVGFGERYVMAHNVVGRGGHVINVERDASGELLAYDPQTHAIYKGKDLEEYMTQTNHINNIVRVDNAIIDVGRASEILRISF